jgi:Fe-S-cluster containining protein
MKADYERIVAAAKAKEKDIIKKMQHLAKFRRNGFDGIVARYHEEVFKKIDCLECGACCRAIGPRFRDKDIRILSKEMGLTPKAFVAEYLKPDVDEEFHVLETLPCPFLNESDNSCAEYDHRPLSCEEFPYTNTHNVQRHLVRLGHSAMFCPAAALIVEKIIAEY